MEPFKTIEQKNKEKRIEIAGKVSSAVGGKIWQLAKLSSDPNHAKIAGFITSQGVQWVYRNHGATFDRHLTNLYDKAISSVTGLFHHDHEIHTSNTINKITDEIWAQYAPKRNW